MTPPQHPRSLTHVGVVVPDVEAALDWYEEVLGFDRVMEPMTVEGGEGHMGELCADVLGEFDEVRIAHTATGNGVGVEFFEFAATEEESDGEADDPYPDPTESGFFHVCVRDPDVEGLAADIEDSGGEHVSEVWHLFPDQEYLMTYCADPWGNLVEVYSHGYERIYSNQDD